ncbi:MAG: hypothetical protein VX663_01545 [Pseudomonadota bacterium]|nr:hypothetical protein [Pseudomonadota bacterium]
MNYARHGAFQSFHAEVQFGMAIRRGGLSELFTSPGTFATALHGAGSSAGETLDGLWQRAESCLRSATVLKSWPRQCRFFLHTPIDKKQTYLFYLLFFI